MSGTKKTMRSRKPARKRPAMPIVQTESLPRQRAMLRTCAADMTSYDGFRWPEAGAVEAPDWNPEPVCGGGLHGLLDGCGDGSLLSWDEGAKWLVVEVDEWVEIDNAKVKAPRGRVVYVGERGGAIAVGVERYGWDESRCVGGQATAGYRGQATAGNYGQATAGDAGQATAGDAGTLAIRWYDGKRYRIATFYVVEDGIEANVAYRVNERGEAVRVEPAP